MVRLYRLDNIDTKENALPGGKGVRSLGSESRAFYIFFFAPQGLQGFFAAHGFFALQGPQAAIWTSVSAEMPAAAAGRAMVPAASATTLRVVIVFLIICILPMTIRKPGTAEEFRRPGD
jgi:hypothetical protein